MRYGPNDEWLETVGNGAFATGTVSGVRTRRYHALLMYAASPSSDRRVLVSGFDAWLECGGKPIWITQQRYADSLLAPESRAEVADFSYRLWPQWTFMLPDGGRWRQEFFIADGSGESVLQWTATGLRKNTTFFVRPLLACRDYHALQRQDAEFRFEPEEVADALIWRPYTNGPGIHLATDGRYAHDPHWYERFEYSEERARGYDALEDLASPGVLTWRIDAEHPQATIVMSSIPPNETRPDEGQPAAAHAVELRKRERMRRDATSPLEFSASQYIVRRGSGASLMAGYPWFTDWGRDTFIAMRGLCIALNKFDDARSILDTWKDALHGGLLPNVYPDDAAEPDYGAIDAPLWFIIAANDYIAATRRAGVIDRTFNRQLRDATFAILEAYRNGTDFGIGMDEDGLLMAGVPGHSLTWMDARIDGVSVTPRIGKPVEIQCLWVNALESVRRRSSEFNGTLKLARQSFLDRFWCADRGYLADVVDVGRVRGTDDVSIRPNQIFAVGGLPRAIVPKRIGRRIVEVVEKELYTPAGLRTLSPRDTAYCPRYEGGLRERDTAYHQGTVWPWLMGAFCDAWLRIEGDSPEMRDVMRRRFAVPMEALLESHGLGHLPEIASGDAPHTPAGCPFQAWSLGEYVRIKELCAS